MNYRDSRIRAHKGIQKRKKQISVFGQSANKQLDRYIFRRWHNFRGAGRFVIGWLGLLCILIVAVIIQTKGLGRYYLDTQPTGGGVYTEGIVGSFSNANPLYASDDVNSEVSKLVFNSLLIHDTNNQLIGDLASGWQVDAAGTTYTVKLKPNIIWHDGQPFGADDVVFTYSTIQNPDSKSNLLQNWIGVKIEKVDNLTVKFILPNVYSPFPHSLTNGIIPRHLLKDVPAAYLRSNPFNTKNPIGTGPFVWKNVTINDNTETTQSELIQLSGNDKYFKGKVKLDGITIKTYKDEDSLKNALLKNKIISAAGLSDSDRDISNKQEGISLNLMSANMLFLKTTSPLLKDVRVRQALVKGTNIPALITKLDYATIPVREPILSSQIGYNPAYRQFEYNKEEADKLLDAAGWLKNPKDGFRYKGAQKLNLRLTYQSNHEFSHIAEGVQEQWKAIGVDLIVNINQDSIASSRYLDNHDYDVLLYGINIGPDPDVYAYWHSSQIDNKTQIHLNLSEYKSTVTDIALEAARTRTDPTLRAAKYKPFLEAWRKDAPAIGLYQPRYLVVSNRYVYGLNSALVNVPSDRFNNVNEWMINTAKTTSN